MGNPWLDQNHQEWRGDMDDTSGLLKKGTKERLMKKCVIFDCDGVLVDSEMITTVHAIKHLARLGYHISPEESIKRFTGKSAKAVMQEIMDESGLRLTLEMLETIQREVHQVLHTEVQAIEGMPDLLRLLQKTNDICVASSGIPEKIKGSLQVSKLRPYFANHHIFSAVQVKRGKPAPDIFLFAAQQMGYDPKDCIVVEDSPAGVEAALAAKMRVIGFLAGSHAQYDWYQQRLQAYNIPIAHDSEALLTFLRVH
jgi:HAD superfamily hydrolase (TIGR01509 family)